jgi:hypothetical protein
VEIVAFLHGFAIVLRRAATGVMLAILLVTAVAYTALGLPVYRLGPAVLIAAYTIGARWVRRRALPAMATVEAVALVLMVAGPVSPALVPRPWPPPRPGSLGDVIETGRPWPALANDSTANPADLAELLLRGRS